MTLYIGLMSGTSLDGVDGVVVEAIADSRPVRVLAHRHRPFAPALQQELLSLNRSGPDELHRAALAGNAVARAYADAVEALLEQAGVDRAAVRAIGAHGQTVRHRPGEFDSTGYTIQLLSPALLAELTGVDVVADFRSRDVAAGGTGAPLVPAFHRAVFGRSDSTIAVLNLGGIGNVTVLHADGRTIGFDCGPGNALLDHWCRQHTGAAFDADGRWSAGGRVVGPLLDAMLADPYFALPAPKSTGRDLFHAEWLEARLAAFGSATPAPVDVQATLAALTVRAAADQIRRHAPDAAAVFVCGGGALNGDLMHRLGGALPGCRIARTDDLGLPAMQVEACAFAWLATAHVERKPGNLVAVTGARGPRVLGALYPA